MGCEKYAKCNKRTMAQSENMVINQRRKKRELDQCVDITGIKKMNPINYAQRISYFQLVGRSSPFLTGAGSSHGQNGN